jgi:hypothetical protein
MKGGGFEVETVADLKWNHWWFSNGNIGRFRVEYAHWGGIFEVGR